jgi:chromosome segregation ATPase
VILKDLLVKAHVLKASAEGTPAEEVETNDATPRPTPKAKGRTVTKTTVVETAAPDSSSAEIRKLLYTALKKAAAGSNEFDYFKFKEVLSKLSSHIKDEAALYAAAGATASSMKVSAEDLIASAKEYQSILTDERKAFEASIEDTRSETTQKQAELKAITSQIAKLESQKASLESAVDENTQQLDAGVKAFEVAHEELNGEIKDAIAKIKKYIS